MTDRATRRRRSDATSNADRVVAAARRVFAREGQASLEEVAGEAGVGIATLYRHFPNREALTGAVFRLLLDEEVAPMVTAISREEPPRRAFMLIAERLLDLIDRERGLISSLTSFAVLAEDLLTEFVEPFGVLLRTAQEAGDVRDDLVPDDIPRVLQMLILGLSTTPPPLRRRYISLMFDAFTPGNPEPLPPLTAEVSLAEVRTGIAALAATRPAHPPDAERP
ncbi:MAG: TetR family transcriptional regulator [Modestobacter sp.]|nr:TetR family transcriptional regulator [Modestobacter sp.]